MPSIHHVKKARKDYPAHGIKQGDEYWWWKPRIGGMGSPKRYSRTYPKPSQTTNSDFLSSLYSIQEGMSDQAFDASEDMESELANIVEQLKELQSETQNKLDNMPDSLKEGDTGQLLQERIDGLDSYITELEGITFDDDIPYEDQWQQVLDADCSL